MPTARRIAIVGATGAQGGGLARAILASPASDFTVRAITRDPTSVAARTLARDGAEVVTADIDDTATFTDALRGAHGAFLMTGYWSHLCPATEKAQARCMAQAVSDAGVQHVIWSTLEDTRHYVPLDDPRMPTLLERYKVPQFDAKGESDLAFTELGVPVTFLRTSFRWENFITLGMGPRIGPDGTLVLALPLGDSRIAGIAAEDIGRCALGIFAEGHRCLGQYVGVAGDHLTGAEMAAKIGRALGHTTHFRDITADAFRSVRTPCSDELGNMLQFLRDFSDAVCSCRSLERSHALNPSLLSFDDWLTHNVHRIPIDVITY